MGCPKLGDVHLYISGLCGSNISGPILIKDEHLKKGTEAQPAVEILSERVSNWL